MIKEKMEKALNDQIQEELFSAYLYMSMSANFAAQNLEGFASWMCVQAMEEFTHAQRFYNHILERGGTIELKQIDKPQQKWEKPLDAFEAAFEHEKHITSCIHKLYKLSREIDDYESESMLQWFIDEQVEEEDTASGTVEKLKLIGDHGQGILMLDKELGARTFTPPAGVKFYGV